MFDNLLHCLLLIEIGDDKKDGVKHSKKLTLSSSELLSDSESSLSELSLGCAFFVGADPFLAATGSTLDLGT